MNKTCTTSVHVLGTVATQATGEIMTNTVGDQFIKDMRASVLKHPERWEHKQPGTWVRRFGLCIVVKASLFPFIRTWGRLTITDPTVLRLTFRQSREFRRLMDTAGVLRMSMLFRGDNNG